MLYDDANGGTGRYVIYLKGPCIALTPIVRQPKLKLNTGLLWIASLDQQGLIAKSKMIPSAQGMGEGWL